jgi:hypothetical protein
LDQIEVGLNITGTSVVMTVQTIIVNMY